MMKLKRFSIIATKLTESAILKAIDPTIKTPVDKVINKIQK